VHVENDEIDHLMELEQLLLLERISGQEIPRHPAALLNASATHLPVADQSVDVILTSPPYLTRIDYAVAYARELAIIGIDIAADRTLRESLMGTTLIRPESPTPVTFEGFAKDLLEQIKEHSSRASAGYYRKQFQQYLEDLTTSLDQLSRIAKNRAKMVLVVQDSYYKEIPINLADICSQEARNRGWATTGWDQFEVSRTLTTINKAARAYPKGKVAETVMTLEKELP